MNPQFPPVAPVAPAPQQGPVQPQPHFDYSALFNRRKAITSPLFWLILLGCGGIGLIFVVMGFVFINDGLDTPGILAAVAGFVLMIIPVSRYAHRFNAGTLQAFATANGLRYETGPVSVFGSSYNWMITQIRNIIAVNISEKFVAANRSFSEIGNVSFTFGDETAVLAALASSEAAPASHLVTYAWSYIRVPLPRKAPHIILDSLKNDGLFSGDKLPLVIEKGQKLSLEGELDNYFALYAPLDYAQDAYYIFRPKVLTFLKEYGQAYDLEIIDNDLFIYAHKPLSFVDPDHIEKMATLADFMQAAFYETTKNYTNDFENVLSDQQKGAEGQSLQTQ